MTQKIIKEANYMKFLQIFHREETLRRKHNVPLMRYHFQTIHYFLTIIRKFIITL